MPPPPVDDKFRSRLKEGIEISAKDGSARHEAREDTNPPPSHQLPLNRPYPLVHDAEPASSLGAHIDKKTKHWASALTNVHKIMIAIAGICTMLFFGGRWCVREIKEALRQNADALAERIDPAVMRPSKEEEKRRKDTGEAMPPTLTEQLNEIKKIQKQQLTDEGRISKLEDHDAANVNGETGKRLDKLDEKMHVIFGKKPPPASPVGPTAREQGLQ